jgi:hypothetical protein
VSFVARPNPKLTSWQLAATSARRAASVDEDGAGASLSGSARVTVNFIVSPAPKVPLIGISYRLPTWMAPTMPEACTLGSFGSTIVTKSWLLLDVMAVPLLVRL